MRLKNVMMNLMLILLLFVNLFSSCKEEITVPTVLQVNATRIEFESDGGTHNLTVLCNTQWDIDNSSEWLTFSEESGEGNASLDITAAANAGMSNRSSVMKIIAGELSREVIITQEGSEPVDTVPEFTYDIPPDETDMRDLTSLELAREMKAGWNLGNSLEAIGGETAWGNPVVSKKLIDSVKAAGFNAVRIPVAWSKFSDEATFTIEESWMERVEEVVNYVLDNDMYAVMNIHWDGGWMQPTYTEEEYVNTRLAAMWHQIATHFRDYDDYLLFAGTNEVMVEGDYGTPTPEYYTVQNGFNQTFITTVRSTGGRNAWRHLVIQGFNTNIDHAVNFAVIPEDVTEDRMFMEVHYYDPYNFALNENSNITQWGEIATDPERTDSWGDEAWADGQFQKMKTNFVDEGIPVIIGEYGAITRLDVEGHEEFRRYYDAYITQSISEHDCVPFYWDNGYTGNHAFGLFNRLTGEQAYPEIIDAIIEAAD